MVAWMVEGLGRQYLLLSFWHSRNGAVHQDKTARQFASADAPGQSGYLLIRKRRRTRDQLETGRWRGNPRNFLECIGWQDHNECDLKSLFASGGHQNRMTMIEFALPDQPKVCTVKITRFVRRQAGYFEGFPFNLPRKRDDRVAASCLFLALFGPRAMSD